MRNVKKHIPGPCLALCDGTDQFGNDCDSSPDVCGKYRSLVTLSGCPALRARLEDPEHLEAAKAVGWGVELRHGGCKECLTETHLTYLGLCPACFKSLSSGPRIISGPLIFCMVCDTLYLPLPGQTCADPLPCGHDERVVAMPSFIFSALRDARLVEWAERNGFLADAIDELQEAGGDFDPYGSGPERLTLPEGE